MAILGIAMVVMVVRGSVLRGMAAALLGVLMAAIGTAALTAIDRFNFNQAYLIDGLPLIPTVLGIFALPEIIDLAASKRPIASTGEVSNREIWKGMGRGGSSGGARSPGRACSASFSVRFPESGQRSWSGCRMRSASCSRRTRPNSAKAAWTASCSRNQPRRPKRQARRFPHWRSAFPAASAGR